MTAKMAAGGWRIWEVGISYSGRTYAEGKKVGMKDAMRAGWCVLRYSPPGERLARSRARRAADQLGLPDHSADWISGRILPYLRGGVHEVGAGTGTIARRLARHGELVVSEPHPDFADVVVRRRSWQNITNIA